ncbi:MAG: prepilin-type N-terminal cleavage/methylation domain-containing protein [Armatimonadota bacterium]
MLEANCASGVLRAPVQIIRNGRGARFGKYGFSLIELLVVIAVIAILTAMLFPVFISAKEQARQAKCISNLSQISKAWLMYADDNNGWACPSLYYTNDGWTHAWDFDLKDVGDKTIWKYGLLSPYCRNGEIKSCPSFYGGKHDRPYSGYAYNMSYIGGEVDQFNEVWIDQYSGRPHTIALLGRIRHPSATAVFAEGAYGPHGESAQNYLRAPSELLFRWGTVHFRHNGAATVAYADGHVAAVRKKYTHYTDVPWLPLGKKSYDCPPDTGGLSLDDSAYDLD